MTDNLTINLGLRYEYTPWLTPYRNQGAVFDPTQAKSIIVSSETDQIDLSAQALADVGYQLFGDLIQTSSQAGLPIQLTENDLGQWAPRVGFAYRLGDRTVLRGGYGMFYEAEGTSGRLNFHFLPFSMSETVNATNPGTVVPNANDGRLLPWRAVRLLGRQRRLEPADARCRFRNRPALEFRRAARNRQPHEPRSELRRDEGLEPAGG